MLKMARFCPNCGAGLADAAQFCNNCGFQGAQQAQYPQQQPYAQQQYQQTQYPQPYPQQQYYQQTQYQQPPFQQPYAPPPAQAPPAKKGRGPLIAVIVAAAVLVAVAVGIFTKGFGLFGGEKGGENPTASNAGSQGDPTQAGSDLTQAGSDPTQAGSGSPAIWEHNYTGDYAITYRFTNSDSGGDSTQVYMHNAQGYYMSFGEAGSQGGYEALYIKNGDAYDAYMNMAGTGFTSAGASMPRDEVEKGFIFLSTKSAVKDIGIMKRDGSETVAGRSCEKYTAAVTTPEASGKVSYSFDKQTGVLLKWTTESTEGSMVYECTEFKTSGVTLPQR